MNKLNKNIDENSILWNRYSFSSFNSTKFLMRISRIFEAIFEHALLLYYRFGSRSGPFCLDPTHCLETSSYSRLVFRLAGSGGDRGVYHAYTIYIQVIHVHTPEAFLFSFTPIVKGTVSQVFLNPRFFTILTRLNYFFTC